MSPPIDLSDYSSATLDFAYWYDTEPFASWDQRWVQIGVDGDFSDLLQLYDDPMRVWNDCSLDIIEAKVLKKSFVVLL